MAFILFETGSAKWVVSKNHNVTSKAQFTSDHTKATPYSEAYSLMEAINNAGVDRYKDTIIVHDLNGLKRLDK